MSHSRKPLRQLFDEFYTEVWGERWPRLRSALAGAPLKVEITNPFPNKTATFSLDGASLVPPRELAVQPGEKILDLCAAPGGKALMMLFESRGEIRLTVNELSRPRFQRLKAVLYDYIPDELMSGIEFNCGDGARFVLRRQGEFDKVLLDAPCSGERHLLKSEEEMTSWTPSRSKQLSVRQHSLLCAALDSVRVGGRVVYSTCSISPRENDGVIEKLHKSRAGKFVVIRSSDVEGEPTEFGRIYLPDVGGNGPIYCAILEKT